jgi:hypothetical protein
MPTVVCPVEGFEEVSVTYPDEWLYKHFEQYHFGVSQAPDNATEATKETYGSIALCDKIEGIATDDLFNLPLHAIKFFNWLKQEVYFSYLLAVSPPKKKS